MMITEKKEAVHFDGFTDYGSAQWPLSFLETDYEDPEGIHLVGKNASDTKPAKFLVFLVKDKGSPLLIPVND